MAGAVTHSLVHQFAAMKPTEFGATIEPKWQVADKLVKEVRSAVEKQQLTPLDAILWRRPLPAARGTVATLARS